MSKDSVFQFFTKAAQKEQLQEKLEGISSQEALVNLGKEEGFEFSSEHVEEAIAELQQKPGFFRKLAEAVVAAFNPPHDDYPAIGVQPFSGEPNQSN